MKKYFKFGSVNKNVMVFILRNFDFWSYCKHVNIILNYYHEKINYPIINIFYYHWNKIIQFYTVNYNVYTCQCQIT